MSVPEKDMRQRLIDEAKKQNKPYGLYFDDIQGGFTLTTRSLPQAFQVLPVIVYKVYADGRPDELVRGVDIVGTLAARRALLLPATSSTSSTECAERRVAMCQFPRLRHQCFFLKWKCKSARTNTIVHQFCLLPDLTICRQNKLCRRKPR